MLIRLRREVTVSGLIRAAGVGSYLGAALVGIGAVAAYQITAEWQAGLVFLFAIGAAGGWLTAVVTRRRRLPMLVAGALSFPLAVAGSQLGSPRVAVTVMFVAGVVSAVRYVCRRRQCW